MAHYTSDDSGAIDVDTFSSSGGSYEGVFGAGLLTCITPAPGEKGHARLLKHDVFSSFDVSFTEKLTLLKAYFTFA